MSLDKLLAKKELTILGLNSGTSADGLDFAVVQIHKTAGKRRIRFLSGGKRRYPAPMRQAVLNLADAGRVDIDELVYLNNLIGQFMGRAVRKFLSDQSASARIDAIASHGQTVRHLPRKVKRLGQTVRGTLQMGLPEFIAAAAGRPVISDFRQADVAIGNEGAPITVAAMGELFSSKSEPRLIVNIGGMSNYFYFPTSGSGTGNRAADCGPGNSLCDILSQKLNGERFDRKGRRARKGRISEKVVKGMMSGRFFRNRTTSTGRESFGVNAADKIIAMGKKERLSKDDLMASAAELTVRSIYSSIKGIIGSDKRLSKLYLTGGGRYNMFFIEGLRLRLPDIDILSIDELGIDGDLVEAAAYAVMGEACLRSRPLATTLARRAKQVHQPVLGRITQPPRRTGR